MRTTVHSTLGTHAMELLDSATERGDNIQALQGIGYALLAIIELIEETTDGD
jgi:hypothetical protein